MENIRIFQTMVEHIDVCFLVPMSAMLLDDVRILHQTPLFSLAP